LNAQKSWVCELSLGFENFRSVAWYRIGLFRLIIERWWWLILVVLLGWAVISCVLIPKLEINAESDAFMDDDDPALEAYYSTREIWGWDEYAILCVTSDKWFTPEGIERLQKMEAELAAIPHVDSTLSVLDVPLLRQRPEARPKIWKMAREIRSLRDEDIDLAAAESELRDHELAQGNLISEDGRSLNVLIYLSGEMVEGKMEASVIERRREMLDGIRSVAAKWEPQMDEPIRKSGLPFINVTMFENIRHDLVVFGIASLTIFTLAFGICYRRWRFVLMPMACCMLPALGILGVLVLKGIPMALVTSNMPVLLFVLMLPYNVYFIERYRERRRMHPEESGADSTFHALRMIAVPCFFSCTTTLAGFIALSTSRITPIRDFGQMMSVGMAVGFCVVFVFIPAVSCRLSGIVIRPRKDSPDGKAAPRAQSRGLVRLLERVTISRPVVVLGISLVVLLVSVAGVRQLSAESKITSYFWPGSEVYEGLEFIDQNMGGTTWVEVILSSEEDGYFSRKEGLDALALAEDYFQDLPETGNILSLTRLRDEMRKTLSKEDYVYLPDSLLVKIGRVASPELIGQTTTEDFRTARTTIRMKETAPTLNRREILSGLQAHLDSNSEVFGKVDVQVTGIVPVYSNMLETLLEGQKISAVVVPLAVYLMLIVLFRSPLLAFIVLIPQALPAMVLLGVMGWVGIPLDLVTVMIASIAIGVGIDSAIQYTIRFRIELESASGDMCQAIRRTHATVGRAIWVATSIITAGFAILLLSEFFPSVWFGLFTALAMLISQLATLTLLPSLFLVTKFPRARQ